MRRKGDSLAKTLRKMTLKKVKTIDIIPTSPFNFDATFHKPDHFTSGDNYWRKGIRWQTWLWRNKTLGLKFIDSGTVNKPIITVEIYSPDKLSASFIKSLIDEIKYRYNLNLNLTYGGD